MTGGKWIDKDEEGSDRGLTEDSDSAFAWKNREKLLKQFVCPDLSPKRFVK
jgi:hypothetical protein